MYRGWKEDKWSQFLKSFKRSRKKITSAKNVKYYEQLLMSQTLIVSVPWYPSIQVKSCHFCVTNPGRESCCPAVSTIEVLDRMYSSLKGAYYPRSI